MNRALFSNRPANFMRGIALIASFLFLPVSASAFTYDSYLLFTEHVGKTLAQGITAGVENTAQLYSLAWNTLTSGGETLASSISSYTTFSNNLGTSFAQTFTAGIGATQEFSQTIWNTDPYGKYASFAQNVGDRIAQGIKNGVNNSIELYATSFAKTKQFVQKNSNLKLAINTDGLANITDIWNSTTNYFSNLFKTSPPPTQPTTTKTPTTTKPLAPPVAPKSPTTNNLQPTTVKQPTITFAPLPRPLLKAPQGEALEVTTQRVLSGVTSADLESRIEQLRNELTAKIGAVAGQSQSNYSNNFQAIALTNKIDQLTNTVITTPTITGGSITDTSISGGTISGTSASLSGAFTGTTGTFSGLVTAGTLGVGTTSPSDTFALNGPAYFAQVTAPGVTTNRLYNENGNLTWNGSVIGGSVGSWSLSGGDVYRSSGNVGIGTSSPYAKLSVVGEVVGSYFTATSTTATSTFANHISIASGKEYRINGVPVIKMATSSSGDSFFAGQNAGESDTSGSLNTFVGPLAGYSNTSGGRNTFIGAQAGYSNLTSVRNTFIGNAAGYFNQSGDGNVFIGTQAGYSTTVSGNVFIGNSAGISNTTGASNLFLGGSAGGANTTGSSNIFLNGGGANNTGTENLAIGNNSFMTATSSTLNIAIGNYALNKTTWGNNNIAMGKSALYSNTTGGRNIAMGFQAGYFKKSGDSNVLIGDNAGFGVTNKSYNNNTYVGALAGYGNETGSNNSFLGYSAGSSNTTGSNNIFLGFQAGDSNTTGSNNIVIGYDIDATSTTATGSLNIGNLIFGTGIDGTNTTLSSGNIGIGTTSPYAKLSVVGEVVASNFTATSTTATSTFAGAIDGKISRTLASNGSTGQKLLEINTSDSGTYGAFGFGAQTYTGSNPDGRPDHVASFGWNIGTNGAPLIAGQPAARSAIESHYDLNNDPSKPVFEFHPISAFSTTTAEYRSLSAVFNKNTNKFDVSFANETMSFEDTTRGNQYLKFTSNGTNASDGATWNIIGTSTMLIGNNNQPIFQQMNAAGSAFLKLPYIDASDRTLLNPSNTAVYVQGNAVSTFPYASTTALTVSGTAYFPGSGIWNSSGNVGIGTTSPYAKLSVVGEAVAANFTATSTTATSTFAGDVSMGSYANPKKFKVFAPDDGAGTSGIFVVDTVNGYGTWQTPGSFESFLSNANGDRTAGGILYLNAYSTGNVSLAGGGGDVYAGPLLDAGGIISAFNGVNVTGMRKPALTVKGGNSAGNNQAGGILYLKAGNSTGTGTSNIIFYTSPAGVSGSGTNTSIEQMRLLGNGNFGIGTSSPYAKLSVEGEVVASNFTATSTTATNYFAGSLGIGTSSPWRTFSVTGTMAIDSPTLSSTGDYLCWNTITKEVEAGTATCSLSSQRFKTNIAPLSSTSGLAEVMALQPVSFNFKQGYGDNGAKLQLGFIAEQAAPIDPRLVTLDEQGIPNGFEYQTYTAVLTKAIQELNLNVESLASSTPSDTQQGFVSGFFANMFARTTAWLADAANGITKFFAKSVETEELCVRDASGAKTCINKAQLDALLVGKNTGGSTSATANTATMGTGAGTPIIISINGNNPATINIGDTYGDLGAIITSPESAKNFGIKASLDGGPELDVSQISIDTTVAGSHKIVYSVVDQNNATTTAERVVNVVSLAPVVSVQNDTATTTTAQ